jgi:hypothetical protein
MLEALLKEWEARCGQMLSESAKKDCQIYELKKRNIELESQRPLVVYESIKPTTLAATAEELFLDDANEDIIVSLLKNEVCRKMSNELLDQYMDYHIEHIMDTVGKRIKVTGYLNVIKLCK